MSFLNETRDRKQRGQNILEFALVLPILAIVMFGVLDLGRVFFATIGLTNAAREGVRYLSLNPDDVGSLYLGSKTAVIDEADYSGIKLISSNVDVNCSNIEDANFCDSGTPATVTVTYDFGLILGWILPSPITVTRSAEMIVP